MNKAERVRAAIKKAPVDHVPAGQVAGFFLNRVDSAPLRILPCRLRGDGHACGKQQYQKQIKPAFPFHRSIQPLIYYKCITVFLILLEEMALLNIRWRKSHVPIQLPQI